MKRCYHLLTVFGCLVWMSRAFANEGHWAWKPPEWPSIPTVVDTSWVRGPIDAFILNQLESRGLTPAPSASPETLLRRIWLDVLGLPPTEEALEVMKRSTEADPWVKVVDALLASPIMVSAGGATGWMSLAMATPMGRRKPCLSACVSLSELGAGGLGPRHAI